MNCANRDIDPTRHLSLHTTGSGISTEPELAGPCCERVALGKGAKVLSAEVHREFVHHIVEDEVNGQEERQDDRREDGQQREESGEVEENQTHNMSARR